MYRTSGAWIIPIQTIWAWIGVQCFFVYATLLSVQHFNRAGTGHLSWLQVLECAPGVLVMCRWIMLTSRLIQSAVGKPRRS